MPYNYNQYNRPKQSKRNSRPDHQKGQRMEYERNRKKIIASQEVCGICGKRVNKRLKYPNLMCATIDHIIPVSKGGHPTDINNLQLAHFSCNRQKSDKCVFYTPEHEVEDVGTRELPLTINWKLYNEYNAPQLRKEVEKLEATGRHLYEDGIR